MHKEKVRRTRADLHERFDTLLLFRVSSKVMTALNDDVGDRRTSRRMLITDYSVILCMIIFITGSSWLHR